MGAGNTNATWDDDDVRIGVPTAGRAAAAPTATETNRGLTPPARPEEIELREGETELGRPPQVPDE